MLPEEVPFWRTLQSKGDALAIVDHDRHSIVSYADLHAQVQRAADELRCYARSLVLLGIDNDSAGVICYLAALDAGHAVFLVPGASAAATYRALIDTYRPELILCKSPAQVVPSHGEYAPGNAIQEYALAHRRRPSDPPPHPALALVLSTSASTGSPKAVRLSSANLAGSAIQVAEALSVVEADRSLLSLPLSYVYGLSVLHSTLQVGGALVFARGTWADRAFYAQIARARVTSISGVSQTFEYMQNLNVQATLVPSLRRVTHAGGPLDPRLFAWIYEFFGGRNIDIYLMYGQTEACGRITVLQPDALPRLHRSAGQPMRHGTVSISDQGEVVYRGPGVMLGYANSREDLALGDITQGVLQTGDLGYLDESGHLFITGRSSRYCKVFGHRVNLDDVEGFFRTPNQAAAAVEKNGIVVVFLECSTSIGSTSVVRLAQHLQLPPQSFRLHGIAQLPRTDRGKVAYATLRSLLE